MVTILETITKTVTNEGPKTLFAASVGTLAGVWTVKLIGFAATVPTLTTIGAVAGIALLVTLLTKFLFDSYELKNVDWALGFCTAMYIQKNWGSETLNGYQRGGIALGTFLCTVIWNKGKELYERPSKRISTV